MIVHNLHVVGVSIPPDEADAVLVIDPDAVLPAAVTRQRLQAIARKRRKIAKFSGRVELLQFSPRHASNLLQAAAESAAEQSLGFGVFERPDHAISRYNATRYTSSGARTIPRCLLPSEPWP